MANDLLTAPDDCVDKNGEGHEYWQLIAGRQVPKCSDRVRIVQHTLRCRACAKKSMALGQSALEQEVGTQGSSIADTIQ